MRFRSNELHRTCYQNALDSKTKRREMCNCLIYLNELNNNQPAYDSCVNVQCDCDVVHEENGMLFAHRMIMRFLVRQV